MATAPVLTIIALPLTIQIPANRPFSDASTAPANPDEHAMTGIADQSGNDLKVASVKPG
jgi:hypothetical protein